MRCPFCGHEDTQVKDSRPTDDNSAIRRRRYCPSCGSRFTTFERVQLRELTVVKKNGQRVVVGKTATLKKVASTYGFAVPKGAVLSATSQTTKICTVSKTKVKGKKRGTCKLTLKVKPKKGAAKTKKVSFSIVA